MAVAGAPARCSGPAPPRRVPELAVSLEDAFPASTGTPLQLTPAVVTPACRAQSSWERSTSLVGQVSGARCDVCADSWARLWGRCAGLPSGSPDTIATGDFFWFLKANWVGPHLSCETLLV